MNHANECKHTYLVALVTGGLMEDPEIRYEDFQVIHANSAEEAKRKYDEINNCFYFYGKAIEQLS